MKGNPMKEKVIFIMSLICFIGIMWISSSEKTIDVTPTISEELIISPQESKIRNYIDVIYPEKTTDSQKLDVPVMETCSLTSIETDVFTFGNAFQYYRQCLGSDSSFHWKGNSYTTIISEEVNIQMADSVQVKEEKEKNNEVSEIR